MRMSRERIFYLADLIMKELVAVPGVQVRAPDDLRTEVVRGLTEEAKLEKTVDTEDRNSLRRSLTRCGGACRLSRLCPGASRSLSEWPTRSSSA